METERTRLAGRAAAEFVVIVVGVLVALTVDNWNSERRDRELEREYLASLAAELRADSAEFVDLYLPDLVRKDSALRVIAPVVRGSDPVPDDTAGFLTAVRLGGLLGTGPARSTLSLTTFEELQSTGNLHLIGSRSLRQSLVAHHSVVEEQIARVLARASGYPQFVSRYLPSYLARGRPDMEDRAWGHERILSGIRSDDFVSVMQRETNLAFFMRPVFEDLAERTNDLLRAVEAVRRP